MAPEERFVCRFAAEPPQEGAPKGRWEQRLRDELLAVALALEPDEGELGTIETLDWFPDRTWTGRTWVPATARTSTGLEIYGYVSFAPGYEDGEPSDFLAWADWTDQLADEHPEWKVDLTEEVVGGWRGERGRVAAMTLVWGAALVDGGAIATAELADLCVDQCELSGDRFTLLAPDDYRGDFLEVKLFDGKGRELASESLYEDDDEDE